MFAVHPPFRPGSGALVPAALATLLGVALLGGAPVAAQEAPTFLPDPVLPAGVATDLPVVRPNDNRAPAGQAVDGIHRVELEVRRADWRLEAPGSPGLRVAAVGEVGAAPEIPAPLIRVPLGTPVRVTVHNRLEHPVRVSGLYDRDGGEAAARLVEAGGSTVAEFTAGAEGTYLYRVDELDPAFPSEDEEEGREIERDQMIGALVVDPPGGSLPDRILVINIFGQAVPESEDTPFGYVEGLAINGHSWPYTELLHQEVGKAERWRVVNGSGRFHPMHLHGFYFSVTARGTEAADTIYQPRDHRLVVTEPMRPYTTMAMEWTPTREGRWLFHCHLSFHVSGEIRLPGAEEADPEHAHSHMAGLVMGLEVAPGPTDLVATGGTVELDLYANDYGEGEGPPHGFARTPDGLPLAGPASGPGADRRAPGPLLVFNRYQVGEVTVHNTMAQPTGVHWHGLELDGWADGVPGWSSSAGRTSPSIGPGESFTYRLSFLRPGTFIYHSHLDDIAQITGGLYGPLVVLPEGETFDPERDHVYTVGWNTPRPRGPASVDVNGRQAQPDAFARVGETHRFRIIHIAPAGQATAFLTRDGEPVPVRLLAKDGADLPEHQQVPVERLARMGVGETADFTWTPAEPGVYELSVGYGGPAVHTQRWIVEEGASPEPGPAREGGPR